MKFLAFSQRKILGSSLTLPANGLGGSRATSLLVAHFALQNTKFGSEKGKVQNPARIPPQTPPAGGKKAEAGQFHSPRKIVCPAESKLVFRIFVKKCSNFVQKTPPILTFARMDEGRRVTKRHAMPFLRYAPRFFQRHDERAVAHEVVRLSKAQSKIEVL